MAGWLADGATMITGESRAVLWLSLFFFLFCLALGALSLSHSTVASVRALVVESLTAATLPNGDLIDTHNWPQWAERERWNQIKTDNRSLLCECSTLGTTTMVVTSSSSNDSAVIISFHMCAVMCAVCVRTSTSKKCVCYLHFCAVSCPCAVFSRRRMPRASHLSASISSSCCWQLVKGRRTAYTV